MSALEAQARVDPAPDTLTRVADGFADMPPPTDGISLEGAVIVTTDGQAFCGVSIENSNAN